MNIEKAEKIKQAQALRDRVDTEILRLVDYRQVLKNAMGRAEYCERMSDPLRKKDAWQNFNTVISTNENSLTPFKLLDQIRDGLTQLGDSNRFPVHGDLARTIREMRRLARRILGEMPS